MSESGPWVRPAGQADRRGEGRAVRIVGIVLTVIFGVPFLLCAWMAMSSSASTDYHGYALIFGTMLALVLGLPVMLFAPLIVRRGYRSRAYAISAAGYALTAAVLILRWISGS